MEASRNAAKSLRALQAMNTLPGSSPISRLVTDAPQSNVLSSSKQKAGRSSVDAPATPNKVDHPPGGTHDELKQNDQAKNDLLELKLELERERLQAQSKERENELLRLLLASEPAKPSSTFRRAIVMRVYPEEVINAIGVHARNDVIFVAVEATLCSSKSIPIQKITTTFSDGRWQEEMKFIVDTDKMWMEGRFNLELRQKMFASSDDPIIATASISLRRCVDWLQEGGEHSIQIEMNQTSAALKDELTRTMLCLSVKVAAERISTEQTTSVAACEVLPGLKNEQSVIKNYHVIPIQNEAPTDDAVPAALPGIPDEPCAAAETTSVSCKLDLPVEPISNSNTINQPTAAESTGGAKCESLEVKDDVTVATSGQKKFQSVRNALTFTRWIKPASQEAEVIESVTAASKPQISNSSDDEEQNVIDADNAAETKSGRRLELAPNSNRSRSVEFIDSRALRQSMMSLMYQKKAINASNVILVPVDEDSSKRVQSKMLRSLDSDLSVKNEELRKNNVQFHESLSIGMPAHETQIHETAAPTEVSAEPLQAASEHNSGIGANFVATIKGVSFANQRLREISRKNRAAKAVLPTISTNAIATTYDADSPALAVQHVFDAQPVQLISGTTATVTVAPIEEIDNNSTTGCWSEKGLGGKLKLRFSTAWRWLQIFFGRIRSTRGAASIQPFREVLDVETEIQTVQLAEERRLQIQASKLAAKKLLELDDFVDADGLVINDPDNDLDAIEEKLVNAISQLKQSYFELPHRAVKITPVAALTKLMKAYAGSSAPHQRMTAIQNFLQSKWISCQSMVHIMNWIKSPPEEVKFFENLSMRVIDKEGLAAIAYRFTKTSGTKHVALKSVERLLALSKKDAQSQSQRKVHAAPAQNIDEEEEDF